MKLEKVVPFGRSLQEYTDMFALSTGELNQKILGVGDGPASFNAEMTALNRQVISVDPVYEFNAAEIKAQFDKVVDNIITQVKNTPNDWVWHYHASADALKQTRITALNSFLSDYENGKAENRYIVGELPSLPFADHQFDIALCSHFLFLYSEHLDYAFHSAALFEMLRIAKQVKIFPLLTLMLDKSPYINKLIAELTTAGYQVSIETVDYELQRGGNEMMWIKSVEFNG